ncbi:glycoside hydrolase family 9 protein [Bacteroides rodentium JCM 16496]
MLHAQVDEKLKADIISTGYVHSPLPIDETKAFETFGLKKKVLETVMLCDMEDFSKWSHKGVGTIGLTDERCKQGKHSLRLEAPAHPEKILGWGLGRGTCMASFDVGGANWEGYNRLHFYVYPSCEGARSIYLNLYVENDGEIKVPDRYGREGYHEINLKNGQWNECFVEMTGLARDKVTKLSFAIEVFGQESTMGDVLRFDVDDVKLQTVDNPETVRGWKPAQNRILFSTTGYTPDGEKGAIVNVANHDGTFRLKDARTQAVVFTGQVRKEKSRLGEFETVDFSDFRTQGQYVIQVGDVVTLPFYINKDVWDDSAWRILNFLFCERCGYPVPGKHGACHTDLHATYNGQIIPFNGGWHDAADMSQQTLQTGEISYALLQMASRAREKGETDLYNRMMEEALWGIDYVMRSRLGNGMRLQGWGTNLWTDGKIGTDDDAARREVRVHDGALENFLLAGIEAYAAQLVDNDSALKGKLAKIAREDFGFAEKRFAEKGFAEIRERNDHGHAAMASESQYHANISWAASMLYKLTGEQQYADEAVKAIRYTLQCQRTEPLKDKDKTCGFFYRDLAKKSIVHYTHQSRDYAYMEALAALCETQPAHAERDRWIRAMKLYGGYLKNIMKHVYPYGMLPSGIYHKDEVKDSVNFYAVQVGIRSGADKDFKEQLENGIRLDKEHYLRIFPVWFSFKGNIAVHLSTGKAAAICARVLEDKALKDIAEQQLFWIVGRNPFGQSMIYGEGSNYPQLYTALPGETVGEIPVGMQSYFNEDAPYWPQFNTATYKEVWGASAARWLMLVSEF